MQIITKKKFKGYEVLLMKIFFRGGVQKICFIINLIKCCLKSKDSEIFFQSQRIFLKIVINKTVFQQKITYNILQNTQISRPETRKCFTYLEKRKKECQLKYFFIIIIIYCAIINKINMQKIMKQLKKFFFLSFIIKAMLTLFFTPVFQSYPCFFSNIRILHINGYDMHNLQDKYL